MIKVDVYCKENSTIIYSDKTSKEFEEFLSDLITQKPYLVTLNGFEMIGDDLIKKTVFRKYSEVIGFDITDIPKV